MATQNISVLSTLRKKVKEADAYVRKNFEATQPVNEVDKFLADTPPPQIDKEATFAYEQEKKRRLTGQGRASTILSTPESRRVSGRGRGQNGDFSSSSFSLGTRQLLGS